MASIAISNQETYLVQCYDEFEENWVDFNYYSTLMEAEDALKDYFIKYAERELDCVGEEIQLKGRIFHILDCFEVKAEAEAKIHLTTVTKKH